MCVVPGTVCILGYFYDLFVFEVLPSKVPSVFVGFVSCNVCRVVALCVSCRVLRRCVFCLNGQTLPSPCISNVIPGMAVNNGGP